MMRAFLPICAAVIMLIAEVTITTAFADTFYTVTNKTDENTVVAFTRGPRGDFVVMGEYGTGGTGTGDLEIPALKKDPTHPLLNGDDPLISAYPIVATDDGNHVVVVNPGDATVSLMAVGADMGLRLVNTVAASDPFPVSVAVHSDAVVVASVGVDNANGSIAAYRLEGGKLTAVEGSRRDLGARPSTVRFSTDGRHLVVNELVTGQIHAFGHDGTTLSETPAATIQSPRDGDRFQAIPVGFEVVARGGQDVILMSEARFLTPGFELRPGDGHVVQSPLYSWQTGSVSTYMLGADGTLSLVSADVMTGAGAEHGEISACWVVVSADGQTLWSINPLSSSYSAFAIGDDGAVTLEHATAFKLQPETLFFGDAALSADGDEIYQLLSNTGQVLVLGVGRDGMLTPKQIVSGLPDLGAYGMLAL